MVHISKKKSAYQKGGQTFLDGRGFSEQLFSSCQPSLGPSLLLDNFFSRWIFLPVKKQKPRQSSLSSRFLWACLTGGALMPFIGFCAPTNYVNISGSTATGAFTATNGPSMGPNSVSIAGTGTATASGGSSIAIGSGATSAGARSFKAGAGGNSNGDDSIAIGTAANTTSATFTTNTTGPVQVTTVPTSAVAIGNTATANGQRSIAIGGDNSNVTSALADDSIAIGTHARVLSAGIPGTNTSTNPINSVVIGNQATTVAANSVVIGSGSSATLDNMAGSMMDQAYGAVSIGSGASVTNQYGVALGINSSSDGVASVSLGINTVSGADNSTAIGPNSEVYGANGSFAQAQRAVAIGDGAVVQSGAQDSIVIGTNAVAGGTSSGPAVNSQSGGAGYVNDGAIAIGFNAKAPVYLATTVGPSSQATGLASAAFGNNAIASGPNAVAVGNFSAASGSQAVGLGNSSIASGARSVAAGGNAVATATDSVAIGASSYTATPNTVSMGSGGYNGDTSVVTRRIINVTDPVNAQDAATKNYVDNSINQFSSQLSQLGHRIDYVGAMQQSLSNAQPQIPEGKSTAIGIGVGTFHGASASSVGVAHRIPGTNFQLSGNFTVGQGGQKSGGGGVGYVF